MARHNKIDLGPAYENCPQTEEALADVAIAPGSYVIRSSTNAQEFILATAALAVEGNQLYIADHNWAAGRNTDDVNPADETMIAQLPLPRKQYAALLATGNNVTRRDTPLTLSSTAGVLEIGTVGTDHIVAYAREVFNNTSGSSQLIRIKPAVL